MPLSAVVTAVPLVEDLVDARDRTTGAASVPGSGLRSQRPSTGRSGRAVSEPFERRRTITKNVTPSSDATRIVAHSLSGPDM